MLLALCITHAHNTQLGLLLIALLLADMCSTCCTRLLQLRWHLPWRHLLPRLAMPPTCRYDTCCTPCYMHDMTVCLAFAWPGLCLCLA